MSWQTARGYSWSRALRLLGDRTGITLLAVLVAGLALAIPIVVFILAQAVGTTPLGKPVAEISLFVSAGTGTSETKALSTRVGALDGVANVRQVSGEQAWAELQRRSKETQKMPDGRGSALPDILVVEFVPGVAPQVVEAAANAASKLPKVESVQADLAWYRRLAVLWRSLASALAPAAIVTGVLLLAVILGAVHVTARMETDELRVLDQIGAGQDFMRRPFVYAGAVTLGVAAAAALGWTALVQALASPRLAELGREFGLELVLALPPWPLAVAFFSACVLLGAVSGYYFAGRSLRQAAR